jgi:hypothetical protein
MQRSDLFARIFVMYYWIPLLFLISWGHSDEFPGVEVLLQGKGAFVLSVCYEMGKFITCLDKKTTTET